MSYQATAYCYLNCDTVYINLPPSYFLFWKQLTPQSVYFFLFTWFSFMHHAKTGVHTIMLHIIRHNHECMIVWNRVQKLQIVMLSKNILVFICISILYRIKSSCRALCWHSHACRSSVSMQKICACFRDIVFFTNLHYPNNKY